jgi:hypothetical protein
LIGVFDHLAVTVEVGTDKSAGPVVSRRTPSRVDEHLFDSSGHAVVPHPKGDCGQPPRRNVGDMAVPDRENVQTPLHGEQLAACLYRPATIRPQRTVRRHGPRVSATRKDGMPGYAKASRDAGFAVALFGYRHFGASTGEPRVDYWTSRVSATPTAPRSRGHAARTCRPNRLALWVRRSAAATCRLSPARFPYRGCYFPATKIGFKAIMARESVVRSAFATG